MRGLKNAYNNIMKDVEKYYSEEEKTKRARKKLSEGIELPFYKIRHGLRTQKGVELVCECNPYKVSLKFNLQVPIINFRSTDYIALAFKWVSFKDLCELLSEHKKLCESNIITEVGYLKIGFYKTSDEEVYITGVVKGKIVFIFNIKQQLCSYDDSFSLKSDSVEVYVDIDKEVINLCFHSRELMISLEDYSIVGVGDI